MALPLSLYSPKQVTWPLQQGAVSDQESFRDGAFGSPQKTPPISHLETHAWFLAFQKQGREGLGSCGHSSILFTSTLIPASAVPDARFWNLSPEMMHLVFCRGGGWGG